MSESDQTLYALIARCCAANLPTNGTPLGPDVVAKHELIAQLRALLRGAHASEQRA
jgi:hypothetical protein